MPANSTSALPPIQPLNVSAIHAPAHSAVPPSPRRFGLGNPLTHCGATVIGLGTVGLGDRSAEERRRATRHQYDAWKRNKENQEVAERLATGGSTPKKALTTKEVYVRHRQEAQERMERRMEHEMEVARKCREDAARLKHELQQAKSDEKEFSAQFHAYVEDENKLAKERRTGSPLHETVAERTARVQQEMSVRRTLLQTNAAIHTQEHMDYVQSMHEPIRQVLVDAALSREATVQQKHDEVGSAKKEHSSRKQWLNKMNAVREAELKELAKMQKTLHQQQLEAVLERQLEANMKEADRIRDQRTPRSRDANARQEEERQRQRAEERRRQQAEHDKLIEEQLSARIACAEEVRRKKAELAAAREEDRRETLLRKAQLHEETVRSRSPNRGGTHNSIHAIAAQSGKGNSGRNGAGRSAEAEHEDGDAAQQD